VSILDLEEKKKVLEANGLEPRSSSTLCRTSSWLQPVCISKKNTDTSVSQIEWVNKIGTDLC